MFDGVEKTAAVTHSLFPPPCWASHPARPRLEGGACRCDSSAAPREPGAVAQGGHSQPRALGDHRQAWQWQIAGSPPGSRPLPVAPQSSAAPSLSLKQEKCPAAEVLQKGNSLAGWENDVRHEPVPLGSLAVPYWHCPHAVRKQPGDTAAQRWRKPPPIQQQTQNTTP